LPSVILREHFAFSVILSIAKNLLFTPFRASAHQGKLREALLHSPTEIATAVPSLHSGRLAMTG
jgi:hypothetical protein